MAHHSARANSSSATACLTHTSAPDDHTSSGSGDNSLLLPFDRLDSLNRDEFREAAYEVFFTACRSSPGFYGRGSAAAAYHNQSDDREDGLGSGPGAPIKSPGVGMAVTSRVKKALGLKMARRSRRSNSGGTGHSLPHGPSSVSSRMGETLPLPSRLRRPMTSAEIMRQQMRVTEQSDSRLRKTLMRTLVGQMGRRAETIILPLELLCHLKPSEFPDANEYHQWQRRQLKILDIGLLLHPSIPLAKLDMHAAKLRQVIHQSEAKPIDTGKNSKAMRTLCSCVISLAWRSPDGGPTDMCHWADGYPLNVQIYMTLLQAVFDLREETVVLDEVDEMLELIKKTWSMLGINRSTHNLCFAWVLFERYVVTGQVEPDLLGASLIMLSEVANDAKKVDRELIYVQMLARVLSAMKKWCEKRLVNYHENFDRTLGLMESILSLVLSATKILEDSVPCYVASPQDWRVVTDHSTGSTIDYYIQSSSKNTFAKIMEGKDVHATANTEPQRVCNMLIQIARETEELASKERDIFSPILKKWHPNAAGAAAVTLHACYGALLKQHLTGISHLLNETILVLQRARKLEKVLIQMAVGNSDREDGGKSFIREMASYDADMIIVKLLRKWTQGRMKMGKESLQRAKEIETWNPKSKTEPYAQSALELIRFAKEAVESFLQVPVNVSENLVSDLTDSLELLLGDYITFVASCGSKQSYLPTLPPLTRCGCDSVFLKLWRKAACSVGLEDERHFIAFNQENEPQLSVSRGTQRLYIRLNTLHYLLSQLQSLDKALLSPKVTPPKCQFGNRRLLGGSYFKHSRSSIQSACQHVSQVAAYRLIFLDAYAVFYGSLYAGDVASMHIKPALRILRHYLTLLCAIITEKAQPGALIEIMKACFEAYLMVLLAGGSSRVFSRADHLIIEEDFDYLKRMFLTCGEGLIGELEVSREAAAVEGVVALMGQPTEQLVEDFSILACEASGIGVVGAGQKLPMPPTTGRWHRSDPNTILRVLCHRNDRAANHFLKRTFQLAKRCLSE